MAGLIGFTHRTWHVPLLLALIFGYPLSAAGQTFSSAGSLESQAPASSGTDLSARPECEASVSTDDPNALMGLDIWMFVDNQIADQPPTAWGLFNVWNYAAATISIGRTSRTVDCYFWETASGWNLHRSHTYQRRFPSSVTSDTYSPFSYYGVGNYERVRYYNVIDNYGYGYGYTDASVDEDWSIDPNANSCNIISITPGTGVTLNGAGRFQDTYTTYGEPIPACAVQPSCFSNMQQEYDIESGYAFNHDVSWTCYDVTVWRY